VSEYGRRSRLSISRHFNTIFRTFLLLGVCIIGVVFVYYTNNMITILQADQARTAQAYTRIWQLVTSENLNASVTSVLFDEVILKSNFPIVVADTSGQPLFWKRLPKLPDSSQDPKVIHEVAKRAQEMRSHNGEIPIYVDSVAIYKLYYDDTPLVAQLRLIPIVEMALVLGFIALALVGFQYIRQSEQRSIWIGMARETAHQLGTPISSLLGWVNLLKTGETNEKYTPEEIYVRIESDLSRLGKIANRFGMIGSVPKLEKTDVNKATTEVVNYFRERLPYRGTGVQIDFTAGEIPEILLNGELNDWVIEHLFKNSLEAVDPKTGKITVKTYLSSSGKRVVVEISDNGRGIPRRDARRIFRPGFTTKKRGWGLGLSLARRIIEDYHRGSIILAASEPGKGSTFVIHLPRRT